MKCTGTKTKREGVVSAAERLNHLDRLQKLNARVHGRFRDFMTQTDLKAMHASDIPKAR